MTAQLLLLIPAVVVIVRTLCLAPKMNRYRWTGHPWQFGGLALSHMLLCGGSLGIAIGYPSAPVWLLLGLAGQVIFDRRRHDRRKQG